ncbi:putative Fimbrial protein [Cupriavidus taiwanensis]|uniref:fimbrial protein n=1 Tax=Cupriavidus taiwanensis TaxID=164546 RepID=UPI000E1AA840|nr:fimbrial protein [Cupriavidus taiwanensis]SPA29263.1 putative Fimbrial protein [Cupriavidus taiwanensis]
MNRSQLFHFLRRWLVIVASFGAPHLAHAKCTATPSLPYDQTLDSMAIAVNLAEGSTIPGTVRSYQFSGSCTNVLPWVVPGAPIVSCYYGSGTEVRPGVYSTGVPGVGIRLRNAAGQPMTNASGVWCDTRSANLGNLNADLTYSVSVTIEFVKTGPISPGNLDPAQTRFGFGVYNGSVEGALSGTGNRDNYIGFSGTIATREIACNVVAPTTVNLPAISARTLATQGSGGNTPFAIQLSCNSAAIVGMTLDAAAGTPVLSTASGILGLSNAGTPGAAGGAGVQIMNASGTAPVPLQVRNAMGSIQANVPATYRFGARYASLGGTPSPGNVSSSMVFTLDYQ